MLRRPFVALAGALTAAGLVVLPVAGPADAAGTCTLSPPARIAIYKDLTEIPVSVTGDCAPNGYGTWFTLGDNDSGEVAVADYYPAAEEPGTLYVPDRPDLYGPQGWYGIGAVSDANCVNGAQRQRTEQGLRTLGAGTGSARSSTSAGDPPQCNYLDQNEPYSDIRLGTYAAIAGTRNSASKVTFTVTSAIWSTGLDKLINRSMKGELQTQYSDGTWHKVGNSIATGTNGKATFAVNLPKRTWRFAVYSTPYSFDRASTPITR